METYKIVHDLRVLEEFVNWLPDLQDNEVYYVSLFARKKYDPELIKSNDRSQLKRFTTTKERIIDRILQLELPLGRWKLKDTEVSQKSLVLYINPNPRSTTKALEKLGKKLWDLRLGTNFNLPQETLSALHNSKSRTFVVDFDIDEKESTIEKVLSIIPKSSFKAVETRGGYHILVNPAEATKHNKLWHVELSKLADQTGDMLVPIPGTVCGGFIPTFL